MTKPEKLYDKLLASPSVIISFRDFEKLLLAFGFALKRVRGSHRSYRHPAVSELMVIQPRGGDAKPYQVRQFLGMVEAVGLTLDES